MDTIIRNGMIIDGSGNPRYIADIGIENGVVTKIERRIFEKATREIDAEGLMVTPGFIDTHSHSDCMVMAEMDAYGSLEQGITTQVVGNCGDSPAPCDTVKVQSSWDITEAEARAAETFCKDPATFMEHARQVRLGINTAFLAGHNAIRFKVMKDSADAPTTAQLAEMQEIVRSAMKAGMFGYSSGLVYAPSVYAKTNELIALAKVAAQYQGLYASHIRGEGDHVMEAVEEAIRVGRESGARVVVSHLKIMGEKNRGKAKELLERLHRANEDGVSVHADQYPYDTGSAPLITQIPPKYLTKGTQETLRMITNPDIRKKIEYSIFHEAEEFESCLYFSGYDEARIVIADKTPQYIGLTLSQIAQREHTTPIDAMMDILIANDGMVQGIYRCQDMGDILTIMADPLVYTGCDWSVTRGHRDPEQVSGGHPRGYSTMVRRLELVRDNGLRTAEESIRSMTGGPAQTFGLQKRGLLRPGYAADICVLDYPNVKAYSTYGHPFRRNQGLQYVFVNGELAVQDGKCLGAMAGQTILHAV